jgi:hypothetical protein
LSEITPTAKLIAIVLLIAIKSLLFGLGFMIGTYILNKYFPGVPTFNYGDSVLLGVAMGFLLRTKIDID